MSQVGITKEPDTILNNLLSLQHLTHERPRVSQTFKEHKVSSLVNEYQPPVSNKGILCFLLSFYRNLNSQKCHKATY